MIISRKRYEKDIAEAVAKALQEEDERRYMHQRINDAEESLHRRIDRTDSNIRNLASKIARLEKIAGVEAVELKCDMLGSEAKTCTPIHY